MAIRYKSAGALVRAVRIARANPGMLFQVPNDFPLQAEEVVANFQAGLMKRCNRGMNIGDDARFQDLRHDARVINDSAKGIRWSGRNLLLNHKMAKRFPNIHNPV